MGKKDQRKTNVPMQMGELSGVKWEPNLYQVSLEIYSHALAKQMRAVLGDTGPFRSIGRQLDFFFLNI